MPAPPSRSHIPVLPAEVLAALAPKPGETYTDATAGLGGHAALIARSLTPGGRVILNDVDPGNLESSSAAVAAAAPGIETVTLPGNFADLHWRMEKSSLSTGMVLADLGFSSNQMDDPERGFSFMRDGPLDMRLDPTMPVTAAELVNTLPPNELIRILREFGEEEGAVGIVRKIAQARAESPITTTGRFAEVVRSGLRPRYGAKTDPATKSFQALRIAVNDELGALDALLSAVGRTAERLAKGKGAGAWLRPGARVGIISFHSLEDRRVKRAFAGWVSAGWVTDVVGGAAEAGPNEIAGNPRSRSAKFRAVRLSDVTDGRKSL